jgi:hypothetical protein
LLGCGTVGTGVARILINNKDLIQARQGPYSGEGGRESYFKTGCRS